MKKINLCMKTYDYKDETKDVKGKVRSNIHHKFQAPSPKDVSTHTPAVSKIRENSSNSAWLQVVARIRLKLNQM